MIFDDDEDQYSRNGKLFEHQSLSYQYTESTKYSTNATDNQFQSFDTYPQHNEIFKNNDNYFTYMTNYAIEENAQDYSDQEEEFVKIPIQGQFSVKQNDEIGNHQINQNYSQDKKSIFIQNGKCIVISYQHCQFKDDKELQNFFEFILQQSVEKSITLEGQKCSYSKDKKEFLLYDKNQDQMNFFKQVGQNQNSLFQYKLHLNEKEQNFCINSNENIIYISRQQDQTKTIIDAYTYDIIEEKFELFQKNFQTIKKGNIVYMYYENEIKYIYYRQLQDGIHYFKDKKPYSNYLNIYFNIYNDNFCYDDNEVYYNNCMVYNEKYREEIQDLISKLKEIRNENNNYLVQFQSEYKYSKEHSFSVDITNLDDIMNEKNYIIKYKRD